MASPRLPVIFFSLIALLACGPAKHQDPVIGHAFIGPATVDLRAEIDPKSHTVATAHFGDKVDIVATKRRFVRVRTKAGAEGWLADSMLIGQNDIDAIKAQSDAARAYPSQGVATADRKMNVHAQPRLDSPSYAELKEGDKFDVLQHRLVVVPTSTARKSVIASSKPPKRARRENKSRIPPPPVPKPPSLPLDYDELSKAGEDAASPKPEQPAPKEEDWSMVRTAAGQSGWVLSRLLYMAIPDEVAQYAEGRRISSYFSLGKVQDKVREKVGDEVHEKDVVKNVWLWTTVDSGHHDYDFDGFRVFIWSLRHHRYETALIQRRIRGWFPTQVDSSAGTFAVCFEKNEGGRSRREYRLIENVVRLTGEKPCEASPEGKGTTVDTASPDQPKPSEGTLDKLKGKLKSIMK